MCLRFRYTGIELDLISYSVNLKVPVERTHHALACAALPTVVYRFPRLHAFVARCVHVRRIHGGAGPPRDDPVPCLGDPTSPPVPRNPGVPRSRAIGCSENGIGNEV